MSPNSSAMSSPGPKPVNFDFHRPDARMNPHILAPVPVRLSPESPVIPTSEDDERSGSAPVNVKQGRREVLYEQLWNQEDALSTAEESLSSLTLKGDSSAGAKRPMPKLPGADHSENTTDEEDIEDNCSTEIDGLQDLSPSPPDMLPRDPKTTNHSLPHFSNALYGTKPQQRSPPPPPPPRPRSHTRSSSLDLNHFNRGPPAVPPRDLSTVKQTATSSIIAEEDDGAAAAAVPGKSKGRDSRSLQMRIHQTREKNSVIARTINELHQEVSDTLEERIALEYHLEQLKSFGED